MEKELGKIVSAAQAGDAKALEQLFQTYYNDVYYFALKTVKDPDLACDITQETFVEVLGNIGALQAPEAFVVWLRRITYHQCTRHFKKKKDVLVEEDEEGNTLFDDLVEEHAEFIPEAALDQADFRKTVMDMLDALPEEQRAAVLLFYFDELPVAQIAEIQGVSEGTVKSRLNYARKALKKSVEDYEKKSGVKLHSFGVLPLLLWLFKDTAKVMPAAAAKTVAAGVAASTGVSVAATAATTVAGTAVGVKVVAGVLAAALVVGGGTTVGILTNRDTGSDDITTVTTMETTETTGETVPEEPESPDALLAKNILPEGWSYVAADGTEYTAGETMPEATVGDEIHSDAYVYKLGYTLGRESKLYGWSLVWEESGENGWGVMVKSTQRYSYPALHERLNGHDLVSLSHCYENCEKMVTAPEIPATVRYLKGTYYGCASLLQAPVLPEGIRSLFDTFSGCENLTVAPRIPESVYDMNQTFNNCYRLVVVTNLPSGLILMDSTFADCELLVTVPEIPETVEYMTQTFMGCKSLVTVSAIPNVTDLHRTFAGCTSLTGVIEINAGQYFLIDCVDTCRDCQQWYTCETCPDCNLALDVFKDTVLPIQLTGSCASLQLIAQLYDNVTMAE